VDVTACVLALFLFGPQAMSTASRSIWHECCVVVLVGTYIVGVVIAAAGADHLGVVRGALICTP